jgi:hypothetical protein
VRPFDGKRVGLTKSLRCSQVFEHPLTPWFYFIGPNWGWNWFDFLIILASLPILPLNGAPMILRMARLARVVKIFNRIQSLRIIIQGLGAGLNSIFSIMLLLGFVFYIYAVLGESAPSATIGPNLYKY